MRDAAAVRQWQEEAALFAAIGDFLCVHGLAPDPAHYSFAHAALTDPAINAAVERLTDGQVRLTRQEIEQLGGRVSPLKTAAEPAERRERQAARLVAETQAQVDGFADLMRSFRHEASGFGRDLVESAAAIRQRPGVTGLDEIARITGGMLDRLRDTEGRLARATSETDALRAKLVEAQDTARRDPLTGLANRLAFEEAFTQCRDAGATCCLALCDVDHFKRLNDDHGHAVGDRVLSAIGAELASACDGHLVARHGGEEFAVLISGMPLAAAATLLDRARASLAAKRYRNRESDRPLGQVTFSAGVTAVRADEQADAAFARADRLLYTAKAEGRDRVSAG